MGSYKLKKRCEVFLPHTFPNKLAVVPPEKSRDAWTVGFFSKQRLVVAHPTSQVCRAVRGAVYPEYLVQVQAVLHRLGTSLLARNLCIHAPHIYLIPYSNLKKQVGACAPTTSSG